MNFGRVSKLVIGQCVVELVNWRVSELVNWSIVEMVNSVINWSIKYIH